MLISFKHKFIFIHCRKAAGTSVDAYFARLLGKDDLLIGSWCAAKRNGASFNSRFLREILSLRGIKSLGLTVPERLTKKRFGACGLVNAAYKNIYKNSFSQDPTFPKANELMDFVGPTVWNNCFKFTIVRNTYERVVSDWMWRKLIKKADKVTFYEFLCRLDDKNREDPEGIVPTPHRNFELYTRDGVSVVDFIGSVDNLLQDMKQICAHIGCDFDPTLLPHAKKSNHSLYYKDLYGPLEKKLVKKIFGDEIEYHKFHF